MDTPPKIPGDRAIPAELSDKPLHYPQKRRNKGFWILVVAGVLALAALIQIVRFFANTMLGGEAETIMQKPEVYEPTARRLALYCQSDQNLFPKYLSGAWLPDELAKRGHPHCNVSPDFARIEMGGGFYHFGYLLKLDQSASTASSNAWELSLYREGQQTPTHLMTLALARTQRLSADELEKLTETELDNQIKRGGEGAYRAKVLMKLRFGKTREAADVCKEWIQIRPDSWLPRFTYAHIRCRLEETEAASTEFASWVQAHPNFAHCIYLALFQFREGRTNAGLSAVNLALNQPFIEPPGTDGNKFYLGQNGALIAFEGADYKLTLAMCDKMLSDPRPEKWWTRKILRLKAAVMMMKGNQAGALAEMKQAQASADKDMVFSLEGMVNADNKLLAAIEKPDISFLKNPANWSDTRETWFSPFETDETGIHGPGLNIPTPYPKSWKTDEISLPTEP